MTNQKIICSIKDEQIGYTNIMTFNNEGEALRSFSDACKPDDAKTAKQQNDFIKFPDDYSIWVLGILDLETGEIRTHGRDKNIYPRRIATANQYKKPE